MNDRQYLEEWEIWQSERKYANKAAYSSKLRAWQIKNGIIANVIAET